MKMSRTGWLGGLALLAALTAATMATAQQRAAVRVGSPLTGAGLPAPFGATVDGNDNFWVSNFAAPNGRITQLCRARTENCRPGFKTGAPIAPPGGYVGGDLQMLTGIAIGPASDVWAINNWQDIDSCFGVAPEPASTRCGGQGVVVFFGMAKPVRAPQVGPVRQP